ncbi:hypothetical protein MASSI9I_20581 [Massilia sp. 9I]|nr:hypothetical protein MASSI9I_20581 [Massilia sp. 9I]
MLDRLPGSRVLEPDGLGNLGHRLQQVQGNVVQRPVGRLRPAMEREAAGWCEQHRQQGSDHQLQREQRLRRPELLELGQPGTADRPLLLRALQPELLIAHYA